MIPAIVIQNVFALYNFFLMLLSERITLVLVMVSCSVLSDFATPWTVAHQFPLFTEFSSNNTGVGSLAFLPRIFLPQGQNLGLLHCRQILYCFSHQGFLFLLTFYHYIAAVYLTSKFWL